MTQVLYKDEMNKVVAFYVKGILLWTTTYTFDSEGLVTKMIRVMRDGTVVNK